MARTHLGRELEHRSLWREGALENDDVLHWGREWAVERVEHVNHSLRTRSNRHLLLPVPVTHESVDALPYAPSLHSLAVRVQQPSFQQHLHARRHTAHLMQVRHHELPKGFEVAQERDLPCVCVEWHV
jgi:hypothetical protein